MPPGESSYSYMQTRVNIIASIQPQVGHCYRTISPLVRTDELHWTTIDHAVLVYLNIHNTLAIPLLCSSDNTCAAASRKGMRSLLSRRSGGCMYFILGICMHTYDRQSMPRMLPLHDKESSRTLGRNSLTALPCSVKAPAARRSLVNG